MPTTPLPWRDPDSAAAEGPECGDDGIPSIIGVAVGPEFAAAPGFLRCVDLEAVVDFLGLDNLAGFALDSIFSW
jgi:hypothetical protein